MNIRPYHSDDTDALVRISLRAWEPVFASLREAMPGDIYRVFFPDWRESQRKAVEAACVDATQQVWVADSNGNVVGFVTVRLHTESDMGEIYMVAVDPDQQGRGIGKALTAFSLDRMREAGMKVAMVETGGDPGHGPARRTYESAGFSLFPVARYFKKL